MLKKLKKIAKMGALFIALGKHKLKPKFGILPIPIPMPFQFKIGEINEEPNYPKGYGGGYGGGGGGGKSLESFKKYLFTCK